MSIINIDLKFGFDSDVGTVTVLMLQLNVLKCCCMFTQEDKIAYTGK
jgi:hypothetical protein